MKDIYILTSILKDLQKLNEKKKANGMRSVKKGADNNPKVTKMDFLPNKVLDRIAKDKELDEKSKTGKIKCPHCGAMNERNRNNCHSCGGSLASVKENLDEDQELDPGYKPGRSLADQAKLKKATAAYRKAIKTPGKADDDKAIADRLAVAESKTIKLDTDLLREYIEELVEEQKLYKALEEVYEIEDAEEDIRTLLELSEIDDLDEKKKRKKRKKSKKRKSSKSGRTLSKATKKSLDKKADRRCLTRGSVYAEFRAGLGAYYTSGSRKGMAPQQWAHARVNSANPSKSWARVKKRKKCPKKKKK